MAKKKSLKHGFTTGAAAAAAAKGALYYLLTGKEKKRVKIRFLNQEHRFVNIFLLKRISDNTAECVVIKDAGDDPDITHKAQIGVQLKLSKLKIDAQPDRNIEITGGKGVGKITKPGLELPVGEYAINPGPKKMLHHSIENVYANLKKRQNHKIQIKIFVPQGENLAEKTLNKRLGIIGGISILGTTGIVYPMSHEAYIATIKTSIKIAAASNSDTLVYTTGRRSERFSFKLFFNLDETCFVQIGDFFKASIDEAVSTEGIKKIIISVFFGKAVKMAMGLEHTHAARSEIALKTLAEWCYEEVSDIDLYNAVKDANTARHAFSYIYPYFPEVVAYIGRRIVKNAETFSDYKISFRSIIFDFQGNVIFDSKRSSD